MAKVKTFMQEVYEAYLNGMTLEEIHDKYPEVPVRDIDYIISLFEKEEET